ncbi:MAG TPA: YHS domain-containing (seleno)protein [Aliidongia sp.]|uniref:YHS domain-containing (seleno)protein n=1 Tax=Aliidongia sp. TaxID=1914230 RepID=UPI002DDD714C|nr:YHS domain-containing (seleno)protein [Aliidongia sp.]HEV2678611.1 YHS domain-containing (seleno)protein [Aliidongia sp.]
MPDQTLSFSAPKASRSRLGPGVIAAALGLMFVSGTALASDRIELPKSEVPKASHEGVVNTVEGIAIKGYDPVAYFTDGKPVLGVPEITAQFDGASWRFATEAHRRAFVAHPAKYEPDFGGFCAYAVAHGQKADIDPAAFTIVNGKLYLNYTLQARVLWRKDLPTELVDGDKNWPTVKLQTTVVR